MGSFREKQAERALAHVIGPKAVKVLKRFNRAAERQGGDSLAENYRILGKKAAIAAAGGAAVVTAGAVAGGVVLGRKAARWAKDRARRKEAGEVVTFYDRYGKRICDIVIGAAALPVVGAVIAACGIAVFLEDRGPVFYNAPRVGLGGREFTMYKLRSMKVNAPDLIMEDGSTYNGADDPRMTKVGAFMRKTSLDEMPQFLNVLKGDMSVVGPRPDLKRETELYQGDEALKLKVKPGVTGYAAVYGRNSLPWHDRLALDVYYVRNRSFLLDVKVFFRTFSTVFAQEGIYVEDGDGEPALR